MNLLSLDEFSQNYVLLLDQNIEKIQIFTKSTMTQKIKTLKKFANSG